MNGCVNRISKANSEACESFTVLVSEVFKKNGVPDESFASSSGDRIVFVMSCGLGVD
jgi:hypothetical protein